MFYKSSYSYRCCACAFTHEYLEYISENGEIYEDLYEQVEQNIINGKCPHTADVSDEYVVDTSVNAVHIAAAVGTLPNHDVINGNTADGRYFLARTDIFHLQPYMVAVFKSNDYILDLFSDYV